MSEVVTWDIVQDLKSAIAGIQKVHGYLTDIGLGEVIDDRSRLKLASGPVTLIVTGAVEPGSTVQGKSVVSSTMDISFECCVPFSVENAEHIAHQARVDLIRALLGAASRQVNGRGSLTLTGSGFDSDISSAGIQFTLAQVTARAGLTETFSPGT